jgi:hypothetical protein
VSGLISEEETTTDFSINHNTLLYHSSSPQNSTRLILASGQNLFFVHAAFSLSLPTPSTP